MQLSPHFHLREFTSSQTAERLGREIFAAQDIVDNLRALCLTLLEPLRVELGRPMVITSGYRPFWLNEAVGGSKTSAHMKGLAADIKVVGMSPLTFCRWVAMCDHPFDQCIMEGSWTHLAIAPHGVKPRCQVLTAHFDGKGVTYSEGL